MPGLCGFTGADPLTGRTGLLDEMVRRLRRYDWYRSGRHVDPAARVELARVSLGDALDAEGPAVDADGRSAALLDGEIYGASNTRAQSQLLAAAGDDRALEAHLRGLHGMFAAALWDAPRRRLLLCSDRYGMKPLYFAHTPGRFVFGSEIKAVLADPGVSRRNDRQGLVDFFSYGQLLRENTFFEAIRLLPAAWVLEYTVDDDRVRVRRYWTLASKGPRDDRTDDEHVARLGDLFKAAVERRLSGGASVGVSLSGGLDARTVLGAIDESKHPTITLCVGIPGSIDQIAARQMAAITGSRHHDITLDAGFLAHFDEHLRHLVSLTDGHYLSQVISVPTLARYRELGVDVLLRGHAGELLHMSKAYNFSMDDEAFGITDEATLEGWLRRRLRGWMVDGLEGSPLAGLTRAEFVERADLSLRACLDEASHVEPLLHRIWHMFLAQRLRRETAMSMLEYSQYLRVRLPYLDNDVVDALFDMPPTLKRGERIQAALLARFRPAFLDIVNANTGTRIGAGEMRRRLSTLRKRALAKLGVPGYQPYERLGLWLKRELRPLVEGVLLSERCTDRGVLDPDTVRRTLTAHLDGQANHTYPIMAMLIVEVGQRMLLETGDPVA